MPSSWESARTRGDNQGCLRCVGPNGMLPQISARWSKLRGLFRRPCLVWRFGERVCQGFAGRKSCSHREALPCERARHQKVLSRSNHLRACLEVRAGHLMNIMHADCVPERYISNPLKLLLKKQIHGASCRATQRSTANTLMHNPSSW